jgi:hypothetical protein
VDSGGNKKYVFGKTGSFAFWDILGSSDLGEIQLRQLLRTPHIHLICITSPQKYNFDSFFRGYFLGRVSTQSEGPEDRGLAPARPIVVYGFATASHKANEIPKLIITYLFFLMKTSLLMD